jgi:hypothetical protein
MISKYPDGKGKSIAFASPHRTDAPFPPTDAHHFQGKICSYGQRRGIAAQSFKRQVSRTAADIQQPATPC